MEGNNQSDSSSTLYNDLYSDNDRDPKIFISTNVYTPTEKKNLKIITNH